jgi:hypothetical protein
MGAINNMRPDLWAGVIGGVPFVDVINTMSDTSLPLTPPEWPEWGNPIEDGAAYDYMASYCPYTNIGAPKNIRPCSRTGGLTDPRVTYWEPAKWVAKLRPHTTSGRPILAENEHGRGPRRERGAVRVPARTGARLRRSRSRRLALKKQAVRFDAPHLVGSCRARSARLRGELLERRDAPLRFAFAGSAPPRAAGRIVKRF